MESKVYTFLSNLIHISPVEIGQDLYYVNQIHKNGQPMRFRYLSHCRAGKIHTKSIDTDEDSDQF